MSGDDWSGLTEFIDVLELDEEPMAVFHTDVEPAEGFTPQKAPLPTREQEKKGEIDWPGVMSGFSCVMGHIWRARRKKCAAWFSAERWGCLGGAFYLGFNNPQLEFVVHYVSTGVPGAVEGEHYAASPENFRSILELMDPGPPPAAYLVYKPFSLLEEGERPELAAFFGRPESLAGLHQLACYATGDPDAVRSPWGAACSGVAAWPYYFLRRGEEAAVLGGWDPSARKFYKTDELSFTVPVSLLEKMLAGRRDSFLTRGAWKVSRKKADRSRRRWGEGYASTPRFRRPGAAVLIPPERVIS